MALKGDISFVRFRTTNFSSLLIGYGIEKSIRGSICSLFSTEDLIRIRMYYKNQSTTVEYSPVTVERQENARLNPWWKLGL